MPSPHTPLGNDYSICERIARKTGRNFFYSFAGLPRERFQAMCGLYAFMRVSDDISDNEALPIEQRRRDLAEWCERLQAAFRCELAPSDQPDRDAVLRAMADVAQRFHIAEHYLFDVLRGVGQDLEVETSPSAELTPRFQEFRELEQYCYLVAGVVGICCVHIWGIRSEAAIPRAIDCGLGFQLTNILRDLGEDAAAGRVYLPAEDLERFGYPAAKLHAGIRDAAFNELMRFEVDRAKQCYLRARDLFDLIDPVGRPILSAMMQIYGGLLQEIEHQHFDVFTRRISLPRWRKFWIATKARLHQQYLRTTGAIPSH